MYACTCPHMHACTPHTHTCPLAVLALGLRQFAFSEKKSHLANDFAIIFRQIWAAGEIHFLMTKNRSDCYVFGIIGKLFEHAREWCLFQTDILKSFWVIQVSNLEIDLFLSDFGHIFPYLQWFIFVDLWMNEWMTMMMNGMYEWIDKINKYLK